MSLEVRVAELFKEPDGVLVLEDGSFFEGHLFGYAKNITEARHADHITEARHADPTTEAFGEVVFNTGMSGYQEILTDPSYTQQLVVMTYPHQGNYGINEADSQSRDTRLLDKSHDKEVKAAGLVIAELTTWPSNYQSRQSLDAYLFENKISAIHGIDTRSLTLHIRDKGAMRGLILSKKELEKRLVKKTGGIFDSYPTYAEKDLILQVTTKQPYELNVKSPDKKIAALDFGIKRSLLHEFNKRNCDVTVFPAHTSSLEIMKYNPDGIFLSNGPGNPALATYAVKTIQELLGWKPMFGVCMGHQLLALALGGRTFKMKFGHRGLNQPVLDSESGKIEITSQNHGYAVALESLPKDVVVTHINLNDKTCEGLKAPKVKAFSVQYHPESAPGPHDSGYLFDRFIETL